MRNSDKENRRKSEWKTFEYSEEMKEEMILQVSTQTIRGSHDRTEKKCVKNDQFIFRHAEWALIVDGEQHFGTFLLPIAISIFNMEHDKVHR